MKPTSFTRGLVDSIGVKLVALVVALMIWFNASGQQEVKRNYVANLRFVNLPDSLTLAGRIPPEAELSVTGTRRELLFMGFRKLDVDLVECCDHWFVRQVEVGKDVLHRLAFLRCTV